MTLDDAVKEFQSLFSHVESGVTQQFDPKLPVQWSGGLRAFDQTSWALYALQDDAILAWLKFAKKSIPGSRRLKWIVRPELMEFQITIADRIGRHRAVNNRFAVKSQFVTEE